MRRRLVWAYGVAVLTMFCAAGMNAQGSRQHDDEGGSAKAVLSPALVGAWGAPAERTALATEFDVSVWGPGAVAVRDVSLDVTATGEATLKVTRKVVDGRDRVKPGSASIEEAHLMVGGPQETVGPRIEHAVTVARAERRFPDDPKDTWPLDGLRVRLVSFSDSNDTLEVRFDTADGRGSFWQVLTRHKKR